MQEYREYLKYNLKYAGIWNIMEYNAHIRNIVDDFASDGPVVSMYCPNTPLGHMWGSDTAKCQMPHSRANLSCQISTVGHSCNARFDIAKEVQYNKKYWVHTERSSNAP